MAETAGRQADAHLPQADSASEDEKTGASIWPYVDESATVMVARTV